MRQIEFETEAEAIAFRDICDAAYPWDGKRGDDEHAVLVEKHPTEERWCAVVGARLIPILNSRGVMLPREPNARGADWDLTSEIKKEREAALSSIKYIKR